MPMIGYCLYHSIKVAFLQNQLFCMIERSFSLSLTHEIIIVKFLKNYQKMNLKW
jgi:hypothetical protein